MSDELSDFATSGDYRSSGGGNIGMVLGLLFVGLAIGAVAALLSAPKTGKQMRRALRRKYEDAREAVEELGDQAGDWVEKGSDWADKARTKVKPIRKAFGR